MKIGIMQPYFFPYIGYYQLAFIVDKFIFLDDAKMIKKGFVNKNKFLLQDRIYNFTIPVQGLSQNKNINEHCLTEEAEDILKTIDQSYKRSKNHKDGMKLIESCFQEAEKNLSTLGIKSIEKVFKYIEKDFHFELSSSLPSEEKSQNRIIEICKNYKSNSYFNLPGGKFLYSEEKFKEHNINLNFITPKIKPYSQGNKKSFFQPNLSMIDIIMNNNKKEILEIISCMTI